MKAKFLLLSMLAVIPIVSLCGCGSGSMTEVTEESTEVPTEAPTSISDTLKEGSEDHIYMALIDFSVSLKNPSSIQLVDAVFGADCYVKISGENSFGGTSSDWYEYDVTNYTIRNFDDAMDQTSLNMAIEAGSRPNWDINKINAALREYFGN